MLLTVVLFGFVGFAINWWGIPLIRRRSAALEATLSPRGFHHTHTQPVPRFGGLALVTAFVAVSAAAFLWYPDDPDKIRVRWVTVAASLAMFLLGFCDDLRPMRARTKLVLQVLIALAVCGAGVQIESFKNPFSNVIYPLGWLGWPVTVFWLVGLTNIMNLADGIDGLAGGVALMLMGLLVYVGANGDMAYPTLCAAGMYGALLGFLRYNFPPATIYMGDGGAYFLGFLIGMLTLVNCQKGTIVAALIAPLIALALPITDVLLTVARRAMRGLPIFRADRRHLHHRLQATGFSRRRTVLTLYGVSLICLALGLAAFWSEGRLLPILAGTVFLLLLVMVWWLGLHKGWFSASGAFSRVVCYQRESRYALSLSRWLVLEAERCENLAELWESFVFVAAKMGFSRVRLILGDGAGETAWFRCERAKTEKMQSQQLAISTGNVTAIELAVETDGMTPNTFEHLGDLAGEAWVKAALHWAEFHHKSLHVAADMPSPEINFPSREMQANRKARQALG